MGRGRVLPNLQPSQPAGAVTPPPSLPRLSHRPAPRPSTPSCAPPFHTVLRPFTPTQASLSREGHPMCASGLRYVPFDFKKESKRKGGDVLATVEAIAAHMVGGWGRRGCVGRAWG
eukprot:scaffold949_cov74-Isochrysis_galbana.AAC.2